MRSGRRAALFLPSRPSVIASPDSDSPAAVQAPAALVRERAALVDRALADVARGLPAAPASLYDPVRYVLEARGKRLRPAVVVLTAEAFGADAPPAVPAALAAEVFHAFTLVHDDIMDHSDERRGRPTVHVRWDEPTAVLAGDFLMGLSYELLGQSETGQRGALQAAWHRMVRRLCEGQALDKAFETAPDVSVADYLVMIEGKTAALLACCFEVGARLGGASDAEAQALYTAGMDLGRAFQVQDDLLDLTAASDDWGKPIGGDLLEGKRTFLLLTALERAAGPDAAPDDAAFFTRALRGLPAGDIGAARQRMDRLGVLAAAAAAVERYAAAGQSALRATLPPGPATDALLHVASRLGRRAR